ncbi:MAG: hypothetical protein HOY71_24680, partial [Nonomuraea sp.]|nr:hypothetical protein [Nonomuraea sp.]
TALGWPARRTADALELAAGHPPLSDPLTVRRLASGTYTITPRPDRLTPTQRAALTP